MIAIDAKLSEQLGRRAVPAVALFILLSFVSMAALLLRIAWNQDQQAADQARAFAGAALERRGEVIAKEVKDYAAWGEAYQHLHVTTDIDWAFGKQNLGRTLYTDLGYDAIMVIAPDGATRYALVDGALEPSDRTPLDGAALANLVRAARSASPGETKPVVGYVLAAGLPYRVAAAAITTGGDPSVALQPGLPSVLVFADALTPARLSEIGEAAFLHGFRRDPDVEAPQQPNRMAIDDKVSGTHVAFAWTPDEPGKTMVMYVMPWLAMACVGSSLLIFLIMRRAVRTAQLLEQNARALEDAHRRAEHMALHDAVTGLPNRVKLHAHLTDLLRDLEPPDCVAVLYIDLDHFKSINDRLGHRAGDRVLSETAARLRSVAGKHDLVARVGGDEFVMVLANLRGPEYAERISAWLLDLIRAPVLIEDIPARVGMSIGIALAHGPEGSADDMLRRADTAMYDVKKAGGDAYRFAPPEKQLRIVSQAS